MQAYRQKHELRTGEAATYTFQNYYTSPGKISLAENTRDTLTKAVIVNAARGGIKAIPFAGAMLEQMIFGTMDKVEASRQAEQLRTTLAGIQGSIDVDSATLIDVLERVDAQAFLGQQTAGLLQELISVVR